MAFDVAAVLVAVAKRMETINRRLFKLRLCALVGHVRKSMVYKTQAQAIFKGIGWQLRSGCWPYFILVHHHAAKDEQRILRVNHL